MKSSLFLVLFVINTAILYIVSLVWNGIVVFGNSRMIPLVAAVLTGFFLTLITSLVLPILSKLNLKLVKETPLQAPTVYLVANIASLWLLARLALQLGFGIASFWVALILGTGLTLLQLAVRKQMDKSY